MVLLLLFLRHSPRPRWHFLSVKTQTEGNISERLVLQIVLFVCSMMNLRRRAWQKHGQGQRLISNYLFQTGCTGSTVLWMVLSIYWHSITQNTGLLKRLFKSNKHWDAISSVSYHSFSLFVTFPLRLWTVLPTSCVQTHFFPPSKHWNHSWLRDSWAVNSWSVWASSCLCCVYINAYF